MTTAQKLDFIIQKINDIETSLKPQGKDKNAESIDATDDWLMRNTKDNKPQIGKGI